MSEREKGKGQIKRAAKKKLLLPDCWTVGLGVERRRPSNDHARIEKSR
jgi:hypothetical protein